MNNLDTGVRPFSTSEKILAFCLSMAGCEFANETPCFNLFDADILFTIGGGRKDQNGKTTKPSRFAGMTLEQAANEAWSEGAEGHVEFTFILTPRCAELIQAYRSQREEMKTGEGKAADMIAGVMASALAGKILPDEAILRILCIGIKMRPEFLNLWKQCVPLLRIAQPGKLKYFDTGKGHAVTEPGFKVISLNLSEEQKKKMGLK